MIDRVLADRLKASTLRQKARVYQLLINGASGIQELGNRLAREVGIAYDFRQSEKVNEIASVLFALPVKEFHLIGQYYLGWYAFKHGYRPRRLFEEVLENSRTFKANALISLAAIETAEGNADEELKYLTAAKEAAIAPQMVLETSRALAVYKSREGSHRAALKDMEKIIPMARYGGPKIYYDHMNSLAVELGEVGRVEEARNIIKLVLASPLAHAYPEWRRTARDIDEKARTASRSTVAAGCPPQSEPVESQLVSSPVTATGEGRAGAEKLESQPGVLLFPRRTHQPLPAAKPRKITWDQLGQMTISEKRAMLLAIACDEETQEQEYDKLLEAGGMIQEREGPQEIDLEDEKTINDLVVAWCGAIEPEEFVAVITALCGCEDDLRRKEIVDRMVRIAFRESRFGVKTEEEWRSQYEARLKPKPRQE